MAAEDTCAGKQDAPVWPQAADPPGGWAETVDADQSAQPVATGQAFGAAGHLEPTRSDSVSGQPSMPTGRRPALIAATVVVVFGILIGVGVVAMKHFGSSTPSDQADAVVTAYWNSAIANDAASAAVAVAPDQRTCFARDAATSSTDSTFSPTGMQIIATSINGTSGSVEITYGGTVTGALGTSPTNGNLSIPVIEEGGAWYVDYKSTPWATSCA